MAELVKPVEVLEVEEATGKGENPAVTPSNVEVKKPKPKETKESPGAVRRVDGVWTLPAEIKWYRRTKQSIVQKNLGILMWLIIVSQVALTAWSLVNYNAYPSPEKALFNNCPNGYTAWQLLCVRDSFYNNPPTACKKPTKRLEDRSSLYFVKYANVSASEAEDANTEFDSVEGREQRSVNTNHDRRRRLFAALDDDVLLKDKFLSATEPATRRLEEKEQDTSMWDKLDENPQVLGVLLPSGLVVGISWMLILPKYPRMCMYGLITAGVVLCILMGILPAMMPMSVCVTSYGNFPVSSDLAGQLQCQEKYGRVDASSGKISFGFIGIIVVVVFATVYCRNQIDVAALCIKSCCGALHEKKSIVGTCLCIIAVFIIYEFVWLVFIFFTPFNFQWSCLKSGEATIEVIDTRKRVASMCCLLVLTYIYFEMLVQMVIACGVGGWYFKNQRQPKHPSKLGLIWAVSSSSHAVFLAAVLAWPIIHARNIISGWFSKFKYLPVLPCGVAYYVTYAAWVVLLRPFVFLTRFSLISHAFHSGNIQMTSNLSYKLLKRRLGGACVTDTIGTYALEASAMLVSIGFAVCAWVWMELMVGNGLLAAVFQSSISEVYMIPCLIALIVLAQRSLCTFVVIAIWGSSVRSSIFPWVGMMHPFMIGIFVGAMSNIIFSLLAKIIQASIDTTLYCYALEEEAPAKEHLAFHTFVQENVVTPFPEFVQKEEDVLFAAIKKAGKKMPMFLEK